MAPLDRLDTQILTLLQQDASLPVRTLAERVHSSPATVQRRVAQLRESGVLLKQVALVDRRKVGRALTAFVSVELDKQNDALLRAFEQRMLAGVLRGVGRVRLPADRECAVDGALPHVHTGGVLVEQQRAQLQEHVRDALREVRDCGAFTLEGEALWASSAYVKSAGGYQFRINQPLSATPSTSSLSRVPSAQCPPSTL
jgi:DNA-binding Lrp family transcriptional regulator